MNTTLLAAILAGGSVFFAVQWVTARKSFKEMTRVERAQAQIAADSRKRERRSLQRRFDDSLQAMGYRGDRAPVALGVGFAYLAVTLVAIALGAPALLAAAVTLPVVLALLGGGRIVWWSKRRTAFAFQLKQLFDLLRGQLEAGYGTQRAMEMVVPNLPDPLRTEFQEALDATRANKDLLEALREVRVRYPSKGFDLFLAALEIDREQGGSLATTLSRAADMLQREFELNQKANAELAQSKQTFWGVLAILGFISAQSILGADDSARGAYLSPVGLAVLAGGFGWAGVGVFRAVKLFRNAGGEL